MGQHEDYAIMHATQYAAPALPWRWHLAGISDLAPLVWLLRSVERPCIAQRALSVVTTHRHEEPVSDEAERMRIPSARARAGNQHPAETEYVSATASPSHQHFSHLCHLGRSGSEKSRTWRSSLERPAGPMPPYDTDDSGLAITQVIGMLPTCMTTMLPTAAAACAALGEGGSPCGAIFSHLPERTSNMWTSFVAPARRMPAAARTKFEMQDLFPSNIANQTYQMPLAQARREHRLCPKTPPGQ